MKILQVVMNLEYGGVESYVVRLSRALVEMGHEVTVLSGGGPMEQPLRDAGIEVLRASLKRENLPSVQELLRDRKFDIINGQNYNSGRVAHAISRWTRIPFVLTVHGPRPLLKRITYCDWSERVIAISGANRREITGFLGLSPDWVELSFLPVDAQTHCPQDVPYRIRHEFLPDVEGRLIVHVSRFTNRKARVALALIDAMPIILKQHPAVRLLIVGSGPVFDSIASHSAAADGCVRECIKVEGSRDDVHLLFNLACVVVATATTAQEALACGAPLIAAGRTGYLGPICGEDFDWALDVLFGDHGSCPSTTTPQALARDILRVLDDEDKWRSEAFGLSERVRREFSPRSAAESVLAVYEKVVGGR